MLRSLVRCAQRAKAHLPTDKKGRWAAPPMFVGHPDPVSNLRPVVYGATEESRAAPSNPTHPYSLAEFSLPSKAGKGARHGLFARHLERLEQRLEAAQLQARLQSFWLDQFNQRFWTDNNVRFQRAVAEYESTSKLVVGKAPLDDVAPFYREWLAVNGVRLRNYNRTLWVSTAHVVASQLLFALLLRYMRCIAWIASEH
ncbi:hypothetical protein MVES1_003401 [Malassezia vespertilionis]|uniref:Uncharacterized protein n=1 Tax=Malassezia vespertilionis TaxID=2020962 RepID=A0A2N1J7M8_9BASI|nr:uncharacterized protein MVES1_003401 [Malassezia vespertilionis]PKI82462.1 hypothetical protein MVES_003640 [Malassezia vespertilionis]WFD08032.1 hypothetical protein MVES1_003401 [Malassezia vespertilionis]